MLMNYPKISIVTPNYNCVDYLEETILSVLSQNYPNLEYIIVDGGSTDGSVDVIKKYESQLSYWISEKDNGLYFALQKGFDKSTGEIMGWINSDDKYHPLSLFTIADIFSSFNEVNWLVGANTYFDEIGRTVITKNSKKWTKYDFYTHNYKFIQQESTLWRRILWEKTDSKINTELKYAGDFELWLRFFRHELLYVTSALIGGFRLRSSNQLSMNFMDKYNEEAENCINNVRLSEIDRKVIKKYYQTQKVIRFLQKLKIFRIDWLMSCLNPMYCERPPEIYFNRVNQKFEMKD
jgi:glycosyltransferase involved in cell wall biosynthesis